jgi:hypothetical protein
MPTDYTELVRNLRDNADVSGYGSLMSGAATVIERLRAERDEALAKIALERTNHREEMEALERRLLPRTPIY